MWSLVDKNVVMWCVTMLRKLAFWVLVFYRCAINYHKPSGLKQLTFYYWPVSVGPKSGNVLSGFFLCIRVSPGCHPDVTSRGCGLIRGWTGNGFPGSRVSLAEFISLWLQDWGISFLPEAALSSYRPHFLAIWASPTWPLTSRPLFLLAPLLTRQSYKYRNIITPLLCPVG